jgi:hypothetical protein
LNPEGFTISMGHDDYLLRDGAMNAMDMDALVKKWEYFGLKGWTKIDGLWKWEDFFVEGFISTGFVGSCDWLEYDPMTFAAYLKRTPKGNVIGPNH